MPTPAVTSIIAKVNAKFGPTGNKGIDNCRYIKDTTTWSQHAWGNAVDFDVYGVTAQRPYVTYVESLPEVGTVLWASNRPADHTDHIHVEGVPKQTGTPPCASGGNVGNTDPGTWVNCKQLAPETVPTAWICQTSLDPNGKQWTLTSDNNPNGTPVTGAAAGESLLDRLNPFNDIAWGDIALQLLYGVVGIAAIGVGTAMIVNDMTGGKIIQAAKIATPVGKVLK